MERFVKEQNENGTIEKKEREWNYLAEGPRSRTERNDFKKVGTCPALIARHQLGLLLECYLQFCEYPAQSAIL